jgi:2-polyprenyl-6-methoxyphenol hydroxylase-like FAD-dependent oxidoreductase
MKVLIVGAGIAGLALAKALLDKGIQPDVIEQRDDTVKPGAGLYLPGNATRAFGQLGLLPDILQQSMPIPRQDFFTRKGEKLGSVDIDGFWGEGVTSVAMPHPTMRTILLKAVDGLPIRYSRTVAAIAQDAMGCDVRFSDGSRERYDLVVGADGINSHVRQIAVTTQAPTFGGIVAWRFLTENTAGVDTWTVMIGHGRTLLVEPVTPRLAYVYADIAVPLGEAASYSMRTDIKALFADFKGPIAPLLHGTPEATPHFARIESVMIPNWVKGRVVLIGDAAHANSPSMPEGAGMAAEDAIVLARLLATTDNISLALRSFEDIRRPRVAWVQAQSRSRDRLRALPTFITNLAFRYGAAGIYRKGFAPLRPEV